MTLKEFWKEYQHYTRDLTEHERKLGFAGAAVCWLFKRDDFTFPLAIYAALLFFVAYFIADVFQGFFAAITLRRFLHREEQKLWEATGKVDGESEIQTPRNVDRPAFIFFIIKAVLLVAAFIFIAFYILERLVFSLL